MAKSGWGKPVSQKDQDRLARRQREWTHSSEKKARARAKEAARRHMENRADKLSAGAGGTWWAIGGPGVFIGGGGIGGAYSALGLKPMFLIILSIVAVVATVAGCVIVSRKRDATDQMP